jgi:hypothetical protein
VDEWILVKYCRARIVELVLRRSIITSPAINKSI